MFPRSEERTTKCHTFVFREAGIAARVQKKGEEMFTVSLQDTKTYLVQRRDNVFH